MESEHEEISVTLGISIPVDSSGNRRLLKEDYFANDEQADVLNEQLKFSNLIHSLDPNLGIMGHLPSSDIIHEKGTLNSWNVDPHFLHFLPVSTSISSENSILIFGGLNPSSISKKIPPDIDDDDFVLGSTIFQYILDSGIWRYYGTMIEPRCYHACALDGQYLYITGGYSLLKRKHGEMIAVSSTDRLNLIDRQWKSCTNMNVPRAAHALVSHEGYLYAFGGRNSLGSILASVEMYDPEQDFWIEITSLPQPTMGLAATCIMDSVWLIGGITDHTSKDPTECLLSNVFSFIPSVRKWCEEVPLPYACAFSSCISNDYALWLIGGFTASGTSEEGNITSCRSVLQLSLSEKPKWKIVASLLNPRHALTAVLHGDYIYILGGVDSSSKCTSDKVEVINIIGNVSNVCTKMPVPIAGCTSILIVSEKDDYRYIENASDSFSIFSERTNFKTDVENCSSSESSKVSSTIEDNYCIKDNKHLLPKSATKHLHTETFTKTMESMEIPVTQENLPGVTYNKESYVTKDLFNSKVNELKAKSNEKFRYRTSMEMFLDSNKVDPYVLQKEPSCAKISKWLDHYQKFSLSDEKLHKEFFQSRKLKLNPKAEVMYAETEENVKNALEKNGKKDFLAPTRMSSSLSSQHKSFMYVKSDIKDKIVDINLDVDENPEIRKEICQETLISDIKNLKLDKNLLNDVPDESKIIINEEVDEDLFPVILLFGGEYSASPIESRSILKLNCDEDVWDYTDYTMPEYRIFHSAVLLNNKIYIIGGFKSENSKLNENITDKVLYFDICHKLWHDVPNINHARAHHSAVVLKDKIYILGGRNQTGHVLSSVEVYDESCDAWKECESLPYPVLGAAAFSLENSIHIFGGITTYEDNDEIILSNTAIFNTAENNWTISFEMPEPLAFCGIANTLNSIWLFGGLKIEDDNLFSSKDIFKSDIFTRTWNKVAELSFPRLAPVTLSVEEKVYVIGGHSIQDKKEVLTCELIDLAKNQISLLSNLPIAISGRTGVIITKNV